MQASDVDIWSLGNTAVISRYCKFQTKHNLEIDILSVQNITLEWMLEGFDDFKSIMVHVMAGAPMTLPLLLSVLIKISDAIWLRLAIISKSISPLRNCHYVDIWHWYWYFQAVWFSHEISHGYPRNNCYSTKFFLLYSTYEGPTQQQRFVGFS